MPALMKANGFDVAAQAADVLIPLVAHRISLVVAWAWESGLMAP